MASNSDNIRRRSRGSRTQAAHRLANGLLGRQVDHARHVEVAQRRADRHRSPTLALNNGTPSGTFAATPVDRSSSTTTSRPWPAAWHVSAYVVNTSVGIHVVICPLELLPVSISNAFTYLPRVCRTTSSGSGAAPLGGPTPIPVAASPGRIVCRNWAGRFGETRRMYPRNVRNRREPRRPTHSAVT